MYSQSVVVAVIALVLSAIMVYFSFKIDKPIKVFTKAHEYLGINIEFTENGRFSFRLMALLISLIFLGIALGAYFAYLLE
ncbi:hypothetical protein [Desulfuribacillus alkaliarsenatis]|uniref:Uncharacterized protein n=1 Tax=Desulfuribacillus alkaliarsenatis TaxID=766136 RepID=A0A1E5FZ27_9FIRM|nr:hypothetical protein [Desulfuribacillus alkaliarsenatis]OEF95697.1 hypothetical protein BHF68_11360 [Desulfuribacillus alkaliarsenatis]